MQPFDFVFNFPSKTAVEQKMISLGTVAIFRSVPIPVEEQPAIIKKIADVFDNRELTSSGIKNALGLFVSNDGPLTSLEGIHRASTIISLSVSLKRCALNNHFRFPSSSTINQMMLGLLLNNPILINNRTIYPDLLSQQMREVISSTFADKDDVEMCAIQHCAITILAEDKQKSFFNDKLNILMYAIRSCGNNYCETPPSPAR